MGQSSHLSPELDSFVRFTLPHLAISHIDCFVRAARLGQQKSYDNFLHILSSSPHICAKSSGNLVALHILLSTSIALHDDYFEDIPLSMGAGFFGSHPAPCQRTVQPFDK
jgi:hypothetical protein